MRREFFATVGLVFLVGIFPASLFGYQAWRTQAAGGRVVELVGRSPANGGWEPDTIRLALGERVRLRIASVDVVHGFAIPGLGIEVSEIQPGHVEEVEFVASPVGRFAFACTRWCSVDHWRMRGLIEIVDPMQGDATRALVSPPLYQQLHVDLDAPHLAQNVPATGASAVRGAALHLALPANLQNADELRTKAPSEQWGALRTDPDFGDQTDAALWDLVAYAESRSAGAGALARGQQLYSRDCAACHGEQGRGDGRAGINLPGMSAMNLGMKRGPADFTDANQMLGASDVLLQGKILRGGMGTGMPEWGSLYSRQDMWDVIAYLRSFVFR